ncbi:hypothetical protein BGW41_001556 [Actinomortierella wolfii]|nr:hypothetical protein BGW41_001556 [Actinomortierella wolfii]
MLAWFLPWYIIHIYRYDHFEALRLKRLWRLELRSLMTLQLFLALLFLFVYDVGTARIKYWEGFWLNPETHEIIGKPSPLWSKRNQEHIQPLYYTLSMALAFQNCLTFLLQSWWHYITTPKTNFQSSFEFRIHIVASVLVLVAYPLLQYLLRDDVILRESIPQLVFSTMLIFLSILGVRTHFRLKRLMKTIIPDVNDHNLVLFNKVDYFVDVNKILIFTFLVAGLTLGILSIDGLTDARVIAHNKLATDILACNLNFVQPLMWTAMTLLFYPRKSFAHGYRPVSSQGAPIRMVPSSNHRKSEQNGRPISYGSGHNKGMSFQLEPLSRNARDETPDYIPYVPPANPPPALASPTRPPRPRIETTTLYYHEALARQAREQLSPPPVPSSTDHLLKDVEAVAPATDGKHEPYPRQQSPTTADNARSESSMAKSTETLPANDVNDPEEDLKAEVEESSEDNAERPRIRTRVKPDTQTLAIHFGPLYHQQHQASLESNLSSSSSSSTMVSGNGQEKTHSRQTSDSSVTQQQKRQSADLRPKSPTKVHLYSNVQPEIYLSSPLQFNPQYDGQHDKLPRVSQPLTNSRRISPPPPSRHTRGKGSVDSDVSIRTARRTSINAYSLRIMPQNALGHAQQQHQPNQQHHVYYPVAHAPGDESQDPSQSNSKRHSGGKRANSNMGEIIIQMPQPQQRPMSPQQSWI